MLAVSSDSERRNRNFLTGIEGGLCLFIEYLRRLFVKEVFTAIITNYRRYMFENDSGFIPGQNHSCFAWFHQTLFA